MSDTVRIIGLEEEELTAMREMKARDKLITAIACRDQEALKQTHHTDIVRYTQCSADLTKAAMISIAVHGYMP